MLKNNNSRPLEFRLSIEASERISTKINLRDLLILRNQSYNKLQCKEVIVGRAIEILLGNGQTEEGCSDVKILNEWLDRKRGKKLPVFKALCQAVEEDWEKVFDRELFTDVIDSEQKIMLERFMGGFFDIFITTSDDKRFAVSKYQEFVKQMVGSDEVDADTIRILISTFIKEFAYNGRQIRFKATSLSKPCFITSIEISGINQNNKSETWRAIYFEPYPEIVETLSWWWKGDVSICFKSSNDEDFSHSCIIHVPETGYLWANIVFDVESGQCSLGSSNP